MLSTPRTACVFATLALAAICGGQQSRRDYSVLAPLVQDNLAIFPVVGKQISSTDNLLTLDEGLRSGEVVVTEYGGAQGLDRPQPGVIIPRDFPRPMSNPSRGSARVNQLALVNNSSRPLLLLAGEIVMGGKQDRVVAKDRIVRPHSDPIELGVFCVEPHRWTETSANFAPPGAAMAQPSVRKEAMSTKSQQAVWNQVAASRTALMGAAPQARPVIANSSSYAVAVESKDVQRKLSQMVNPISGSYEKLIGQLHDKQAVGVVVAVNGELVWVDVFANPALFEKYWPKLIRSYAAEALGGRLRKAVYKTPGVTEAGMFLENLTPVRESMESEPQIYRNTQIMGDGFDAFILTSLLGKSGYEVHLAKMKKD